MNVDYFPSEKTTDRYVVAFLYSHSSNTSFCVRFGPIYIPLLVDVTCTPISASFPLNSSNRARSMLKHNTIPGRSTILARVYTKGHILVCMMCATTMVAAAAVVVLERERDSTDTRCVCVCVGNNKLATHFDRFFYLM